MVKLVTTRISSAQAKERNYPLAVLRIYDDCKRILDLGRPVKLVETW